MAKKILIVEDNDLNLKLFRDLLGANGYLTFETKEGIEAISMTRNVMPDLIIMDIQLPEISGLDIARKLKSDASMRHIPVLAVTAFAMKDDEQKILAAGCEAYLSKPIAIDVFLSTVRRFLEPAAATA
jgi:two-component system cell cycle response regulator DivK